MRIILIGFMGSGKSTIARALAYRLGFKFIDMDTEIEKQERKTIAKIFAENGESYFRNLELELLFNISQKRYVVVASGGGAICNEEAISLMKQNFNSIFLNVSLPELLKRLAFGKAKRPLLNEENDISVKVELLLKERMKYYLQADIVLDIDNSQNLDIVAEIMKKI